MVATIKFIYIGTNEVATIIPVANQVGASLITIVVSDGLNPAVSNTFGVTVEQVEVPAGAGADSEYEHACKHACERDIAGDRRADNH